MTVILRRRSATPLLLRLWVRIPPGVWMFVSCDSCVLSGRGLCDELIIRPEESYWLWCVVGFDLETWWMRRPWPTGGCCAPKNEVIYLRNLIKSVGRDNRVGMATRYELDIPEFEYPWGWGIPHASIPTVGPIQHPVLWLLALFPTCRAAGAWPSPSAPI